MKLFKIITFLQMIHVSLKEGWFNYGGKNERLWINHSTLINFIKIFTLGSVLYMRSFMKIKYQDKISECQVKFNIVETCQDTFKSYCEH